MRQKGRGEGGEGGEGMALMMTGAETFSANLYTRHFKYLTHGYESSQSYVVIIPMTDINR
jgi:hypothetical protein